MYTEEDIRKCAYEISQRYPDQTPEQCWFEAEEQLKLEYLIQSGECGQ